MLRAHCQTSGVSLTSKDPYNNIVRTTLEALAAVLGGTQSLHTNSFDEALALPTEFSARIARNTQLVLRDESGVTKVVDPLGGSYYIESLTQSIVVEARKLINEVEEMGGMTKAVSGGMPKLRIEEAAARRQVRIDRNEEMIVGVNCFQNEEESEVNIRSIDNSAVRESQMTKLETVRSRRNSKYCRTALDTLQNAAMDEGLNLLEYTIEAAKARATVGEISQALENVFGRHRAEIRSISGVYGMMSSSDEEFSKIRDDVAAFAQRHGRQPRILVAKLGQDGHDRGAKIIATAFADLGFDVDIGPLFQTPSEVVRQAIENDVHVIGISSQAGGHVALMPELMAGLRQEKRDDIVVTIGGVVPPKDHEELHEQGVSEIFGPGTRISPAAAAILKLIEERES